MRHFFSVQIPPQRVTQNRQLLLETNQNLFLCRFSYKLLCVMIHQANQISDSNEQEYMVSCQRSGIRDKTATSQNPVASEHSRLNADQTTPEACQQTLQELSELKTALEQAVLLLRTDACGRVKDVNEKLCKISGYSREELLGKSYRRMKSTDHPKHFFRNLWLTLTSGQVWKGEIKSKAKDGSNYWLEVTIAPLLDSEGNPYQYLAIGSDISDCKIAEAKLTEANRIKDEFLALVSHELRSPLSAIQGWAQLALSRKLDETTTTRAWETIERNAKLQAQLIDDLQDLSRLIRGKLRLNPRPLELASLINTTLDTIEPAIVAKEMTLDFGCDSDATFVYGDSDRLQQVIWKLLSNAIKYTPAKGRIEVRLNRTPSHALLRICDTGCGISPEFLPHIFEYFRFSDSAMATTPHGIGLGLVIVRQLVELHGGNVWASSPGLNQGATFTVQLPLLEAKNLQVKATPSEKSPHKSQPVNGSTIEGLQVLVVDDNQDARDFLLTALDTFGAKVTAVANVKEALAEIEQSRPDVLVSDIAMPGEDGYELIRRVRAMETAHSQSLLPAVALTAFARQEDCAFALATGFQKYLSKPVEPSHLVNVLAELATAFSSTSPDPTVGTKALALETATYLTPNWESLTAEPAVSDTSSLISHADAPLLLVVEDNTTVLTYLQSLLGRQYRVAVARDGVEGLEKAKSLKPDLILSDQMMPRKNGLDLLRELRHTPELQLTPVIFLTARMGSQARIESFDAGADDYISKPFDEGELLARVKNLLRVRATEQQLAALNRQLEQQKRQLESANQALQHRASFDSLTEVANRHYFSEYLNAEWRRLAREHKPLSLIMCDIDYFKLFNDSYGHQAGDECLRKVAAALRQAAKRSADLVARYGGEEFAVILPNTDAEGATFVAQTIRNQVVKLKIEHENSPVNQYVTVSLGVACWVPAPQASSSMMIAAADEALYAAKAQGRNRVAIASYQG